MTISASLVTLEELAARMRTDAARGTPDVGERIEQAVADIRGFHRQILEALYADQETGQLTGENTMAAKSCADVVDAIAQIVDEAGLTPEL